MTESWSNPTARTTSRTMHISTITRANPAAGRLPHFLSSACLMETSGNDSPCHLQATEQLSFSRKALRDPDGDGVRIVAAFIYLHDHPVGVRFGGGGSQHDIRPATQVAPILDDLGSDVGFRIIATLEYERQIGVIKAGCGKNRSIRREWVAVEIEFQQIRNAIVIRIVG